MSLLGLFKKTPKWRHADPKVRLRAVMELPAEETSLLLELAGEDPEAEVRRAALARIGDWRLLAPLAARLGPAAGPIERRVDDLRLAEILAASGSLAKRELIAGLSRAALLAEVVLKEIDLGARRLAVEMIADQEILADLARQSCGKAVGFLIVERISDRNLLDNLTREASSRTVRARAGQRAASLAAQAASSPEALRQGELATIAGRLEGLAGGMEVEAALSECRRLQRRLRELAPDDDGLSARLERLCQELALRQREAAARQETERAEHRRQEEALAQAGRIVSGLKALSLVRDGQEEEIRARLKADWMRLAAETPSAWLAPFREPLAQAEADFAESREELARERAKEAELLAALNEAESRLAACRVEEAAGLIAEAQARFDGWHPKILSRQQVAAALIKAREGRQAAADRVEEARLARAAAELSQRRQWLEELRGLSAGGDYGRLEAGVKELTTRWRQPLTTVPDPGLEAEFAALSTQAAERLAALRQQEDWRRWHHKTLKQELVEAANDLDLIEDPAQVFKRLKELQEAWRLAGPAPAKDERGLWLAFKEATDRNFVRCREFFVARDQEAEVRLAAKAELVKLATDRQDSEDWLETAGFMRDLQARWKAIGPAPRDREQELFAAFRAACDHFFVRRQEHVNALEAGREGHRAQKETLCQEAEALAEQPELGHKAKFKDLQARWKAIGPAPKAQEELLWQRFRAAGDRYYAWLDTLRPENMAIKDKLCQEIALLTAELGPSANFAKLGKRVVELQRQWKELGPAPAEHQEELWQRFKGGCDRFFAARAAREAEIDRDRFANQARREALLAKVKELTAAPVSRETVREIIACQEEWRGLGPGDKDRDRTLRQEFAALGAAFFKERREAAQEIERLSRENLQQKESLCLRLEIMAGSNRTPAPPSERPSAGGLTLAEQLKLAFETNFVLAAGDAKGADKARLARDEIERVRREWQRLGPAPPEHEHQVRRRYTEALAAALKRAALTGESVDGGEKIDQGLPGPAA